MTRKPRKTWKYQYPDGYKGITNNPERRAEEHRREGRKGKMEIIGKASTREGALKWERESKARSKPKTRR